MTPPTLVIGFGSTLRGDDAIGRIAAERLRRIVDDGDVKVIDCHAPTPELAQEISEANCVVILDASVDGLVDEVMIRPLSENTKAESMAHRLDASALLGLSRQWFGRTPEAYAITFRGQQFDFRDRELSPRAEAAVDQMVNEAILLIQMAHANESQTSH